MGLRVQCCRRRGGSSCRPWGNGLPETSGLSFEASTTGSTLLHWYDQNGCVINSCEEKERKKTVIILHGSGRPPSYYTVLVKVLVVGSLHDYYGCQCRACICIINHMISIQPRSMIMPSFVLFPEDCLPMKTCLI